MAERVDVGSIEANAIVVVACEGPEAARLLGLSPVRSRPVSCVYFGAPSPPRDEPSIVLDGGGSGPAVHAAVMTNVAPGYAPLGGALISVACPGTAGSGARSCNARPDESLVRRRGRRLGGAGGLSDSPRPPRPKPTFLAQAPRAAGRGTLRGGDHRDTASIQGALYSGLRAGTTVLLDLGVMGSSG